MNDHRSSSAVASSKGIRVLVARDASAAGLVIGPGSGDRSTARPACLEAIEKAGIRVTAAVAAVVDALLAGTEDRTVIANWQPPLDGEDARIDWAVKNPLDQAPSDDTEASHYERSGVVLVKEGQVLAHVTEPTAGTDGRDVRGRVVKARPGKALPIQIDTSSIYRNDQGQWVSTMDGMLRCSAGRLQVRPLVDIAGNVDFSTGNIRFHGSVRVKGDVLDRFVIEAGGDIEVFGTIEAAHLTAKGSLIARGGIAAYPDGIITVDADVTARYIENARIAVGGNVVAERTIMNSEMKVAGNVAVPRGALAGGTLTLGGRLEAAVLGTPAGAQTRIAFSDPAKIAVIVTRAIHPGVSLVMAPRHFLFTQTLPGPVQIDRDGNGHVMIKTRDGKRWPLASLGEVRHLCD